MHASYVSNLVLEKEAQKMNKFASLILLSIMLILVVVLSGIAQASNQQLQAPYGCITVEVTRGCNVPQEVIDNFKDSESRARVDEHGTLWWSVNFCSGSTLPVVNVAAKCPDQEETLAFN
jgi:hypothetical protein